MCVSDRDAVTKPVPGRCLDQGMDEHAIGYGYTIGVVAGLCSVTPPGSHTINVVASLCSDRSTTQSCSSRSQHGFAEEARLVGPFLAYRHRRRRSLRGQAALFRQSSLLACCLANTIGSGARSSGRLGV